MNLKRNPTLSPPKGQPKTSNETEVTRGIEEDLVRLLAELQLQDDVRLSVQGIMQRISRSLYRDQYKAIVVLKGNRSAFLSFFFSEPFVVKRALEGASEVPFFTIYWLEVHSRKLVSRNLVASNETERGYRDYILKVVSNLRLTIIESSTNYGSYFCRITAQNAKDVFGVNMRRILDFPVRITPHRILLFIPFLVFGFSPNGFL